MKCASCGKLNLEESDINRVRSPLYDVALCNNCMRQKP